MLYLFLVGTGILAIYLFLVRMPLIRYINYSRSPADALRFNQREDYWMMLALGFLGTLWWLSTIDLKYHFIY
jgi:hypothetical protein